MELYLLLYSSVSLRNHWRYGLKEATALLFGRVSFRLKNYIKELVSVSCNMAIRLTAKATFLLQMCLGALEKLIATIRSLSPPFT